MGYRSDVAMRIETINGLNVETVLNELKEQLAQDNEELGADSISISPEKDCLTLTFDFVEWFNYFNDVQIIMDWFDRMEELADDWAEGIGEDDTPTVSATQYIRVGENLDDIDERCTGDMADPMYVNRAIVLYRREQFYD